MTTTDTGAPAPAPSPHGGLAGIVAAHRIGLDVPRLNRAMDMLAMDGDLTTRWVSNILDACSAIMAAVEPEPLRMTSDALLDFATGVDGIVSKDEMKRLCDLHSQWLAEEHEAWREEMRRREHF